MFEYFLSFPHIILAVIIVGFVLLVSFCLNLCINRFMPQSVKENYKSITPPLGSSLMAGFILYTAILTNSVNRNFDVATHAVLNEGQALRASFLIVDEEKFPEWHASVNRYIEAVVRKEWAIMSDGKQSEMARQALDQMHLLTHHGLQGLSPDSRRVLITGLKDIENARQTRLLVAQDRLPAETWWVVFISALAVLSFYSIVLSHNKTALGLMAVLNSAVIGMMIFSIIVVDRPFIGSVSVSPQPLLDIENVTILKNNALAALPK